MEGDAERIRLRRQLLRIDSLSKNLMSCFVADRFRSWRLQLSFTLLRDIDQRLTLTRLQLSPVTASGDWLTANSFAH